MSLAKVFSHQRIGRLVITNIGKRMPSPVTERTQWDTLTVSLRESLQASSVYRHGEVTIANGESRQRVQCINMRIIARHHFMTVNYDITCQSVCSKRWSKKEQNNERYNDMFQGFNNLLLITISYYTYKSNTKSS